MRKVFALSLCVILVLAFTACCGSTGTTWQEQYDLGMQYLTDGDYEAAIVAFTAAIEIDAKDIQAYTGLVQAYIGTGDYEAAVSTAGQGAEALGDSGQEQADGAVDEFTAALLTLGGLCLESGDYESAETIYSLIIGIDEDLVDAYIVRAEAYLELGEQEKALEDYRKALELLLQGETGSIREEELKALIAELEESITEADASSVMESNDVEEDIYLLTEEYDVYTDGSRKLTREYTYDEFGVLLNNITYELGPDGTYVTEYFYTEDNEDLPISLNVVDDSGETIWSNEYIYDDSGNLICLISYTYEEETDRSVYTYDEYGNTLSYYWYYSGEFGYGYDYQYVYDLNGNVLNKITFSVNKNEITGEYNYTYDDSGNVLTIIYSEYNEGQVLWQSETIYTYGANGNVLSDIYTSYDAEGQINNQSGAYYTYDENGNILSKYYDYSEDMYVYVYDDEILILETYYNDGEETSRTEYSYDALGNILTETHYYNEYESQNYVHEYVYTVVGK